MPEESLAAGEPVAPAPAGGRGANTDPGAILAVAAGGILGASARYAIARLVPVHPGAFPWATFWTNVSGSFLLGVVLVVVLERLPPTRYLRPFFATGVLGAFTTFSTMVVEGDLLVSDGHTALALAYLVLSMSTGVAAAFAGMVTTRAATRTAARRPDR